MKLNTRDAKAFFAKPDLSKAACLIYGADAMRVALKRADLVASAGGPDAEADMRITRLEAADVRSDAAALSDAAKAAGFFPGQRVVVAEGLNDQHLKGVQAALADWGPGDAFLVLTAGALKKTSKLRKMFEDDPKLAIAAIYDDPPNRSDIEAEFAKAGLAKFSTEAVADLVAMAASMDPGDLRQLVEKLAVYKLGDDTPLSAQEVANLAPLTLDAAVDDLAHAVAEGQTDRIGPLMQRLKSQGTQPVFIAISVGRHFRTLHAAACDPGGPNAGINRVRPPVFGPRKDRMARQASRIGRAKLESALGLITETDLTLRSAGRTAPEMALVERGLVRLAILARN